MDPTDLAQQVLQDPDFRQRYELGEKLGEGGMGAVYHGFQKALNRAVAIKFMNPELMQDPRSRERFLAEATLAAKLIHTHVVAVYDFGIAQQVPYLVTEFVEGESLLSRLGREPCLPSQEVLRFGVQILEGLQAIHDLGIIHRDLKPANILITAGAKPLAKILDFGIAKQLDGSRPGSALTRTGAIVGTPDYMSPEQCLEQPPDFATDQYSFAVILYQMVVGRLPFRAPSLVEQLQKHISEAPVIPPNLGSSVVAILLRGLAKKPQDRFASAEDFAQALRQLSSEHGSAGWVHDTPPDAISPRPAATLVGPARATTQPPSTAAPRPDTAPLVRAGTLDTPVPPRRSTAPWLGVSLLASAVLVLLMIFPARSSKPARNSALTGFDVPQPMLELVERVRHLASQGHVSQAAAEFYSTLQTRGTEFWDVTPYEVARNADAQACDWALTGILGGCAARSSGTVSEEPVPPSGPGQDRGSSVRNMLPLMRDRNYPGLLKYFPDERPDWTVKVSSGNRRQRLRTPPHGILTMMHEALTLTAPLTAERAAVGFHRLRFVYIAHRSQPVAKWCRVLLNDLLNLYGAPSQRYFVNNPAQNDPGAAAAVTALEKPLEDLIEDMRARIQESHANRTADDQVVFRRTLLALLVINQTGEDMAALPRHLSATPELIKRLEAFVAKSGASNLGAVLFQMPGELVADTARSLGRNRIDQYLTDQVSADCRK